MSNNKVRVTLSLSEENVEWLDAVSNNRSGYVDEMLTEGRSGEYDTRSILAEFEMSKLDAEENALRTKLQAVRNTKEELESAEEEHKRETWERAVQNITPPKMKSVDTESWTPDPSDDAVEHFAAELEIEPAEFVERYPEKRAEVMG